jgi:amidophosphoribosyltransferase
VIDDSIVRGNTQRAQIRMLREAGALEIHVRISSPPVKWPCFYGIDFATRAELIANGLEIDGIRRSIGADSLGYVSLDNLIQATEQPKSRLCMACFDGQYPIELPAADLIGKHVLEGVGRRAGMPSPPQKATEAAGKPRASQKAVDAAVSELEADYEVREHADDHAAPAPLVASPGGASALHHP